MWISRHIDIQDVDLRREIVMDKKESKHNEKNLKSAVVIVMKTLLVLLAIVLLGGLVIRLTNEFSMISHVDYQIRQHWPYFLVWRWGMYVTTGYLLWTLRHKLSSNQKKGLIRIGVALVIIIESSAFLQILRG